MFCLLTDVSEVCPQSLNIAEYTNYIAVVHLNWKHNS